MFYDQTLIALGYKRNMVIDIPERNMQTAGYKKGEKPSFWIGPIESASEDTGQARGVHFAFLVSSKETVDARHARCLELGGKDNGAPGQRLQYHSGYYRAFIIDPSGWRIEAVFHGFEK